MRRCAGAGKEHRQTESWAGQWTYSMPWHHDRFMKVGWPRGRGLLFLFHRVWILSCLGVCTFLGVQSFLGVLQNLLFPGVVITAWGPAANWSSDGEKECILYSLFCIFIIIITIFSINISFVALLNSLYLNHEFPPLSISPPHPAEGEEEGWASGCLVLSC